MEFVPNSEGNRFLELTRRLNDENRHDSDQLLSLFSQMNFSSWVFDF